MDKADKEPTVPLREFMCREIDHVKELMQARIEERDKARVLQAAEISRRLLDLNHAHEQNIERNAEFVSEEKFGGFVREFREYKETTSEALTLAQGSAKGTGKTLAIIIGAVGFISTMLFITSLVIGIATALYAHLPH